MPQCDNPDCDAHVTQKFRDVFAIDGTLHSCPVCADAMPEAGRPEYLLDHDSIMS